MERFTLRLTPYVKGAPQVGLLVASSVFLSGIVMFTLFCDRSHDGDEAQTLVLYSFSAMREVIDDGILPLFRQYWKKHTGKPVGFITAFAGSGLITDRITKRLQPEIVILASELDALRLRERGTVMIPSRECLPHRGIVSRSPMVIIVRSGNPKSIGSFEDLTKRGARLVLANPRTSGGAQWSLIAAYSEFLRRFGTETAAIENVTTLCGNVIEQTADARRARESFAQGRGDAIVTYEAEAIAHLKSPGVVDEIVYPEKPLISEHIVMKINRNIQPDHREVVDAFLSFLWSEVGQRTFVAYGFRSVDERLNAENASFHEVNTACVLEDLGGAGRARNDIILKIVGLKTRN